MHFNHSFKTILLSISFLMFLLLARFVYTKTFFFGFYIWNTFLAVIPILLSSFLLKNKLNLHAKVFVFVLWLLFFPNAAYLITDVLHFKERKDVPLWFDVILVIQASWVGLICTIVSLKDIETFFRQYISQKLSLFFIISIVIVCSYGVYLGRFLRFNSWDIFTNPNVIIHESIDRLMNPFNHVKTYCFVFFFSLFIGLKFSYYRFNSKPS